MLSGLIASPALGQQPEKVKVLIGFNHQPGAAEQSLVHRFGGTIKYTYRLVPAIAGTVPEPAIAGLRANPNVTHVELDGQVYAMDAELVAAWGVEHIGVGVVHDGGNLGTGVKVAVIDTGIDCTHIDLNANCAGGYDFVNDDNDPMDDAGHGTHVAGTIAAEDNEEGVVGVAPAADLYALKVLGANGSGSFSDVIAALEWAVKNGMQVTNNSYGSAGDPGISVQAAFDNAWAAGILNVCSAGNTGNPPGRGDNVGFPGRYASCIAVAATDSSDNRARFSSTGPDVELAAPGVSIYSTVPDGYATYSGTSMASPHVAGTAALVLATNTGWTNDQVRTQLQTTADDLGDLGRDTKYGYGLVDADEAAGGHLNDPPVASFTYECIDLTCSFDASDSYDRDGSTVSYHWVFGDGETGSGVTPGHVYAAPGTFAVSLTVTDGEGATDMESQDITVGGSVAFVYVFDIEMSLKTAGINRNAVAEVNIHDSSGQPVAGATVHGSWSDATSDTDSGLTGTDGTVLFVSDKVKNATSGSTFTFTVDGVVLSGWTYDSAANAETSDSISIP
jgi:subtilisin